MGYMSRQETRRVGYNIKKKKEEEWRGGLMEMRSRTAVFHFVPFVVSVCVSFDFVSLTRPGWRSMPWEGAR